MRTKPQSSDDMRQLPDKFEHHAEELDFTFGGGNGIENKGRDMMDDLMLKVAIWQDECWVNPSALSNAATWRMARHFLG